MKKVKEYDNFIRFGNDFIEVNSPKLARKFFEQALEIKPNDPVALDGLAWTYHMEGDNVKARQLLQKAINLNPDFAEAYTDLGCVLQDLGEEDEAEKMHKKCLELDPTRYDAKWNLAHLYYLTDRFDELESFLEDDAEILTKRHELLQMLGEVKIIKNDLTKAKKIFEQCLKADEHNVEAGILLSYVDFELTQNE